jgi:hypothetical protein
VQYGGTQVERRGCQQPSRFQPAADLQATLERFDRVLVAAVGHCRHPTKGQPVALIDGPAGPVGEVQQALTEHGGVLDIALVVCEPVRSPESLRSSR